MGGKPGDFLKLSEVRPIQQFTEPPARFSEGTLVSETNSCICRDFDVCAEVAASICLSNACNAIFHITTSSDILPPV